MRLRKDKQSDSHAALAEAQKHVREAASRNPEIYQISGSLRRLREYNHFAETLYTLMGGITEGNSR